jgi:flagellar hook protein FlgE
MSFTKSLNALNAAARNLEIIGNNVANANTVGYKAGQLYFSEVLANSRQGNGVSANGAGAAEVKVLPQFAQGNIEITGNQLDLAINGKGMFVVKDAGQSYYTRAGQFVLDEEGYVSTPSGGRLQGFAVADDGSVATAMTNDLQIGTAGVPPNATSEAAMKINLDSRKTLADPAAFRMGDSSTYQHATSMPVFDSLGKKHVLGLYFVKSAESTWNVFASSDGVSVGTGPIGQMAFQSNGQIDTAASPQPFTISVPVAGANNVSMTLDFSESTSLGRDFSINGTSNDGKSAGQLTSYSVDSDGFIVGRYTNGTNKKLGQVALALFNNPQGLSALGARGFSATVESGNPELVGPDNSLAGAIQSGALEKSNVDLTSELVRMIEAQRVYQANAQAIKTQNELMQSAENIR